jgi:hypothetical protein
MSTDDKKPPRKRKAAAPEKNGRRNTALDTSDGSAHDLLAQDIRRYLHRWMVFGMPENVMIDLYAPFELPIGCTLMEITFPTVELEVFIAGWQPTIPATMDLDDIEVIQFGHTWITDADREADPRTDAQIAKAEADRVFDTCDRMRARRDNPLRWAPRAIPKSAVFAIEVLRLL